MPFDNLYCNQIHRVLGRSFDLLVKKSSLMHIIIHGALTLGNLESRKMTLETKHYAIRYHWFREISQLRNIELVNISTTDQPGDTFAKGLTNTFFKRPIKKCMYGKIVYCCQD